MKITVATCALNQWSLDFTGNLKRTIQSFKIAKYKGACYRLGPELELCGYGANDHFLEMDTITHSFEMLFQLMQSESTVDIIGDVGMPVIHRGVRYNCRIIFYNKKVLLIRPKKYLANDGNYREMRYFSSWTKQNIVEDFDLPERFQSAFGQFSCKIGDGAIKTPQYLLLISFSFATELCEELFTPDACHINISLNGIEMITNGSASHHEFQKLHRRIDLIREATLKCGGIYLYANQQGCDGERLYYDGAALIVINGVVVAQSSQFSLNDVEVITATVDLEEITAYRAGIISRGVQASMAPAIPLIHASIKYAISTLPISREIQLIYHTPSEEIQYGPACWLWDYLRRSKQNGFFLPLSGGIDSCSTALIVFSMCELVFDKIKSEDSQILSDLRAIVKDYQYQPKSSRDICSRLLYTAYMGTRNSSDETEVRATKLANSISSTHVVINIDPVVDAIISVFYLVTGKTPTYKVHGGSNAENLALQNIQARTRMVVSYLFAQLSLWSRDSSGSLLVLGSSNVDETLRGYFTKYDCSSADLNPIGGISKVDLRNFVFHMSKVDGLGHLNEFLAAKPTAELEPITDTYIQTDEVDMGMTYAELSTFGQLRKVFKLGPFSMYKRLVGDWAGILNPIQVAEKVKRFFSYYGINRHKTTVLPPSYHMSQYSPDDNRFDHRPILYPAWDWQFERIDVSSAESDL